MSSCYIFLSDSAIVYYLGVGRFRKFGAGGGGREGGARVRILGGGGARVGAKFPAGT